MNDHPEKLSTLQQLTRISQNCASTTRSKLEKAGIFPAFTARFGRSNTPLYSAKQLPAIVLAIAPNGVWTSVQNPNAAK
jgi:hypothetical protein